MTHYICAIVYAGETGGEHRVKPVLLLLYAEIMCLLR